MLLQHVALYRNFINTLPCLVLINELRVRDSELRTSEKSLGVRHYSGCWVKG